MNTEDFKYNGMLIPKNTVIILNCVSLSNSPRSAMTHLLLLQWNMHHNPERYPDPHKFNVSTEVRRIDGSLTESTFVA